jgi:hypothetical protein
LIDIANLRSMRAPGLLLAFLFLPFISKSQLVINELMAANATTLYETDYYNFPDWIEIFNSGTLEINMQDYYLSDDIEELQKFNFPLTSLEAGEYYLIYCDKKGTGRHTIFGLDIDGESLYLSDISGNIVDYIRYPELFPDISYGRNPSAMNQWFYCAIPTPGEANQTTSATERGAKAGYSIPAGRLNSSASLSLSGSNIRYTTNGAEPKSTSTEYSQPISISNTMIVKSKTFQNNYLPGETYANTYFLNEHNFTLPVVSISYTPDYFYNNTIGIYVEGTNGIEGNCYGEANWNQNWERTAYFEYFDENGVKQLSQPVGVKVAGGCSRSFANQKSLAIYARNKYGNDEFDYFFFKEKPDIGVFNSIFLRNSGNDVNQTQLRDAFLQALVTKSVDLDYQAYRPVIAYFNGSYWGIMNIREKIDEDYFYSNYALSDDSIDFLEGILRSGFDDNYVAIRGITTDFNDIISFISSNSLANEANYEYVVSKFDLQEYLNYMAVQIYIANTDWPGNNLKFWKKSDNGKWRWILFDTDFGFGAESYTHATIEFATETNGPDWPNPSWSTLLFRKLMENEGFQKEFQRTIITLRNTAFHPDWCSYVIDSLSAVIDYEITYHKQKWGGNKNDWYNSLNRLKNYAVDRYNFIPGYVNSYFGTGGDQVVVSISNPDKLKGDVAVNESVIKYYPLNLTTSRDLKLSVEALPAKGFIFSHWQYASQSLIKYIIETGIEWSYLDEAGDYPANWTDLSFDDSSWDKGFAQLGYGDGDETTVISYGGDPNNKNPCALFRKKFTLADTSGMTDIELGLNADDGAIVYLNGQEIFRNNMPAGTVDFNSYASEPVPNENSFLYTEVDRELFNTGENIIACEVHQANATSSDVSFDISISYRYEVDSLSGIYSQEALIESDTGFNISLEPVFEEIEGTEGIYLNEIASVTSLFRDEFDERSGFVELYNNTGEDIAVFSFFLSDDENNLMRYAIPDSTVIPANGFITFYMDGEGKQGIMHTAFKADTDGESMYLSQKVGGTINILDSVSFEFLVTDHSFGKYVDGTGEWLHMVNITPGQPNNPDRLVFNRKIKESTLDIVIYPNPSDGNLLISVDENDINSQIYSVDVVDISGRIVYPQVWLNSNISHLNLTHLNSGLYFARIYKGKRPVSILKLIIVK